MAIAMDGSRSRTADPWPVEIGERHRNTGGNAVCEVIGGAAGKLEELRGRPLRAAV